MKSLNIKEVARMMEGDLILSKASLEAPSLFITSVSTDTRKIEKGDLFIALQGENFDGHRFIEMANKKGACAFVVAESFLAEAKKLLLKKTFAEKAFIVVRSPLIGLQTLAKNYIKTFEQLKIVGVTGSNGKTTTKDMLFNMLSPTFKVTKNLGNFNNEIGLPLSVLTMDESCEIGVFEMGMSELGEIDLLSQMIEPDIGIITNVGHAHLETLKTKENILKAKTEISNYSHLKKDYKLILNYDDPSLSRYYDTHKESGIDMVRVGQSKLCEYQIKDLKVEKEGQVVFQVEREKELYRVSLALGEHNAYNGTIALVAATLLGADMKESIAALEAYRPDAMRMDVEVVETVTIINDTYNASPESMKAAIKTLKNMDGKRKIAILGDMLELGENSPAFHEAIGAYSIEAGLDFLFAYGKEEKNMVKGALSQLEKQPYPSESKVIKGFSEASILLEYLEKLIEPEDIVLFKGSRGMQMEMIVDHLKVYLKNKLI